MALKIVSGLDATSLSLSSFLDLQKNELRNAQIHNLTTTQIAGVGTPATGQFAYDTTLNKLKVYNGSDWELVGAAADGTTLELSSNTLSIKAAGVGTTQLAAGAVTTAKIGAAQVTGAKMAALTIATGNIANLAVTSGKLAAGAVGTAKLADDAVTTAKIADDQITAALIADDAVGAAAIADNSIDVARLNTSDGSAGQFLKTDGAGNIAFATPVDTSVSSTNLTATLAALDTTHAVNVHGSGSTAIVIGSSTNTPNVQVTGDVIVDGNLMVSGTTTTVNSTTISVTDPIITLGGATAPSSDDNKDRGIEFRYYDSSASRLGFFGYDDSDGKFAFIPDATDNSNVFSGNQGTLKANIEAGSGGNSIKVGDSYPFNDNSGSLTLTNIDNIDSTTEATLESAIDSLANLVTVGTITTGVWSGTSIAVNKGGTGLTSSGTSGFIPVSNGTGFVMQAIDGGTYS